MQHFYVDRKGIIVLSLNSIPAISTEKQSRVKTQKSKNAKKVKMHTNTTLAPVIINTKIEMQKEKDEKKT